MTVVVTVVAPSTSEATIILMTIGYAVLVDVNLSIYLVSVINPVTVAVNVAITINRAVVGSAILVDVNSPVTSLISVINPVTIEVNIAVTINRAVIGVISALLAPSLNLPAVLSSRIILGLRGGETR